MNCDLKLIISKGLVPAVIFASLLLASCGGWMGGEEPSQKPAEEQHEGTLKIFVPSIAPWILEGLGATDGQKGTFKTKAVAYLEDIHLVIRDNLDNVVVDK